MHVFWVLSIYLYLIAIKHSWCAPLLRCYKKCHHFSLMRTEAHLAQWSISVTASRGRCQEVPKCCLWCTFEAESGRFLIQLLGVKSTGCVALCRKEALEDHTGPGLKFVPENFCYAFHRNRSILSPFCWQIFLGYKLTFPREAGERGHISQATVWAPGL